jgi:hypothetical protein
MDQQPFFILDGQTELILILCLVLPMQIRARQHIPIARWVAMDCRVLEMEERTACLKLECHLGALVPVMPGGRVMHVEQQAIRALSDPLDKCVMDLECAIV